MLSINLLIYVNIYAYLKLNELFTHSKKLFVRNLCVVV
jgi:hypothetical protein